MFYDELKYINLYKKLIKSIVIMSGIMIIFDIVIIYITIMGLPIDNLDTNLTINFFVKIVFVTLIPIVLMLILSVNWISIFLKYSINDIKKYQTDILTGLKRRRVLFDQRFQLEYEDGLGIIYIDINDFKIINDKYGHQFGDTVLVNISKQLHDIEDEFKEVCAYRMGGDEFVLTVLTGDINFFTQIIDLLKDKLNKINMNLIGPISVSIGTAYENEKIDLELLINLADERMYAEKKKYKDNKL